MKQIIVVDENPLGQRLDTVRALLANTSLSPWARAYWITVERALTRKWKSGVLGIKTHSKSTTYVDSLSY